MDSEGLKTKTDILNAINALYDEKTRESALASEFLYWTVLFYSSIGTEMRYHSAIDLFIQ